MKILIDNGYGQFTPGKRLPDGEFREAFYNREIGKSLNGYVLICAILGCSFAQKLSIYAANL